MLYRKFVVLFLLGRVNPLKSAAKVGIICDLQNKKSVKNAWQMRKMLYLCKPIIIRELFKELTICVLIAFLMAWESG